MAKNQKTYDSEFKTQAVKLAQEIGGHKAAKELGAVRARKTFYRMALL